MGALKIITLNVRGLGNWRKRQFLAEFFVANKIDVCLLQETHVSSKFIADSWVKIWGGKCFWSFGTIRSRGVGIWFKKDLNFETINISNDSEGRLLSILVNFNDNYKIKFINIYAPVIPRDRRDFFGNILQYLSGPHPTVLGGTLIV